MTRYAPATTSQTTGLPEIISDEFLSVLRRHGVGQAHLFGGFARGEATLNSDIDLLVHFVRPATLFDQLRLADQLEAVCGRRVDLSTELHPAFAPYIAPTMVALPL